VIYCDLALHAEDAHDFNQMRHLVPLMWYFRAAIALLVGEIMAGVVALVAR